MVRTMMAVLLVVAACLASATAFAAEPPEVGEMAPDFTLKDERGKTITLSETVGDQTTIVLFYRGHW